jgi:hypothetical protein
MWAHSFWKREAVLTHWVTSATGIKFRLKFETFFCVNPAYSKLITRHKLQQRIVIIYPSFAILMTPTSPSDYSYNEKANWNPAINRLKGTTSSFYF